MPAAIAYPDAQKPCVDLLVALASKASTVIMDFTCTAFCDTLGLRDILGAYRLARGFGVDLRLIVPPGTLAWILAPTGADRVLQIYPTMRAALEGANRP